MPDLQAGNYDLTAETCRFLILIIFQISALSREPKKWLDIALQMATVRYGRPVVGFCSEDSMEGAEKRESSARDVGEAWKNCREFQTPQGRNRHDIVLRGFSGKDLNVLIDGQRILRRVPQSHGSGCLSCGFAEVDSDRDWEGFRSIVKNQGSLGGVVNIVNERLTRVCMPSAISHRFLRIVNPSAAVSYGRETFSILEAIPYRISSPYTGRFGKRFYGEPQFPAGCDR